MREKIAMNFRMQEHFSQAGEDNLGETPVAERPLHLLTLYLELRDSSGHVLQL